MNSPKNKEKTIDDICTAPRDFPLKDLTRYSFLPYKSLWMIAKKENFAYRVGSKLIFVNRDRYIAWINSQCEKGL
jgi:hypothetical protein